MRKSVLLSILLIILTTVGLTAISMDSTVNNGMERAGTVIVGNGTAQVNDLPVNPSYLYSYSQSIYLRSEIPTTDHLIDTIWYYWDGMTQPEYFSEWTVLMGHTTKTEFLHGIDWIPYAELTQVYFGTVNVPAIAGWIEIPLQQEFVYNGVDNLVVAVNETEKGSGGGGGSFLGTNTPNPRSLLIIDEGDTPFYGGSAEYFWGEMLTYYPDIKLHFADEADLASPVVTIEKQGANLKLDWQDVTGASSYQVYESDTPQGAWTPIMPVTSLSECIITSPSAKKFYHVTALSD